MEKALEVNPWLAGDSFSMADVALAPYVNRLAALSLEGIWAGGRLPRVEAWFDRVRDRPTFHPAFRAWMPDELAEEMRENGRKSWPDIRQVLGL